jgi:2-polyprenyl-3-methyl-5-hydroxy-6-metoxy-1,4-benzoquinol methylase
MKEPKKNDPSKTDTAHLDWDERWQTEKGRSDWIEPEVFVAETIDFMKKIGVKTVLDLGCGVGRHAVLLAKAGFAVHAVDASPTAVEYVGDQAFQNGVEIKTKIAGMTEIPFENNTFDYLLAWNVIYHGDLSIVLRSISEILRVLKSGGLFQGTMLSKRNAEIKSGKCIAKDTYINSACFEKRHPHFYCNAFDLTALLNGFEPLLLKDREHRRKGSYHWHFLAEKL